jgi:hypothetical protein
VTPINPKKGAEAGQVSISTLAILGYYTVYVTGERKEMVKRNVLLKKEVEIHSQILEGKRISIVMKFPLYPCKK